MARPPATVLAQLMKRWLPGLLARWLSCFFQWPPGLCVAYQWPLPLPVPGLERSTQLSELFRLAGQLVSLALLATMSERLFYLLCVFMCIYMR